MSAVTSVFGAQPEQLRAHAHNVDAVAARFDAIKTASAHVAQNDAAYGFLCGWIAAVLEGRHNRQDELIAYVEENLALVSLRLRGLADHFDGANANAKTLVHRAVEPLG